MKLSFYFINILLLSCGLPCSSSSLQGFKSSLRPLENRLISNTGLLTQVSTALQVPAPWNAPRWIWSFAWNLQRRAIPFLHRFDKCQPKDNNLNLAVLWWKAIAGNNIFSSTFDGFIAYDLLPHFTRMIVGLPFVWFYPNLHHSNVALRTAFLDNSLLQVTDEERLINDVKGIVNDIEGMESSSPIKSEVKPRVITLGAGFDTRSLRFAHIDGETQPTSNKKEVNSINRSLKADFYELDLPSVVSQKMNIFKRFLLRRPKSPLPSLYGADLNNLDEVKVQLSKIFADNKVDGKEKERPTVFIIEAVLMYLKEENVMPLLSMCMSEAAKHSASVNLCFADRLPGMPQGVTDADLGVEEEAAVKLLRAIGMDLKKWQPKPGRARHMGIAKFIMA
mmetsp:Transcript_23698/g.22810  ORF Transcript_23698/g.22810 Transcript_23698/m.22810 type:complete len:392 (-) Transcript_23698:111-1286(-)